MRKMRVFILGNGDQEEALRIELRKHPLVVSDVVLLSCSGDCSAVVDFALERQADCILVEPDNLDRVKRELKVRSPRVKVFGSDIKAQELVAAL